MAPVIMDWFSVLFYREMDVLNKYIRFKTSSGICVIMLITTKTNFDLCIKKAKIEEYLKWKQMELFLEDIKAEFESRYINSNVYMCIIWVVKLIS